MIDIHSHILPGIDDGSPDFETSIKLVKELASGGVTEVIATPHYVDETIYTSSKASNLELLAKLQKMVDARGIKVRLLIGNEIYIFPKIAEYVKAGKLASLADSEYLLVELPMSGEFSGYEDIFLDLMRSDYKVILAHPERYDSFQKDFALVSKLFDMGVLLQCNLGSLVGQYGKSAQKLAIRLAKEKMIFAMGSDIHHNRGTAFLPKAMKKIRKYYNNDEAQDILVNNPRKIYD